MKPDQSGSRQTLSKLDPSSDAFHTFLLQNERSDPARNSPSYRLTHGGSLEDGLSRLTLSQHSLQTASRSSSTQAALFPSHNGIPKTNLRVSTSDLAIEPATVQINAAGQTASASYIDNAAHGVDARPIMSRCASISNIDPAHWYEALETFIHHLQDKSLLHSAKVHDHLNGQQTIACVCLNDLRDTDTIQDWIVASCLKWHVTWINHEEFAGFDGHVWPGLFPVVRFGGLLLVTATFSGEQNQGPCQDPEDIVREVLEAYGPIYSLKLSKQLSGTQFDYEVEYFKITDAREVIASMTSSNPDDAGDMWTLIARDIPPAQTSSKFHDTQSQPASDVLPRQLAAFQTSPTGRSVWRFDARGNRITVQPNRIVAPVNFPALFPEQYDHSSFDTVLQTPRSTSSRAFQSPSSVLSYDFMSREEHASMDGTPKLSQNVSVASLEEGMEVRTTLMLRNIPNRMNLWDVKKILDKTSYGRYDFFYLRIDFARNANVGYGFVNFINGWDLSKFVRTHEGQPWHPGNNRTCGVSFATIQGLDCLIEKFRNSAVMEEAPDFRPKIFFTEEDAPTSDLVGTERPFPLPNNQSKKQRSRDNASHLGLFTPQSNHHARTQGRRSQYDRGTPAQLQEDSLFNPEMNHIAPVMSPGNYTFSQRSPVSHMHSGMPSPIRVPMIDAFPMGPNSPYNSSPGTQYSPDFHTKHGHNSGSLGSRSAMSSIPTTPISQTNPFSMATSMSGRPIPFPINVHQYGFNGLASASAPMHTAASGYRGVSAWDNQTRRHPGVIGSRPTHVQELDRHHN